MNILSSDDNSAFGNEEMSEFLARIGNILDEIELYSFTGDGMITQGEVDAVTRRFKAIESQCGKFHCDNLEKIAQGIRQFIGKCELNNIRLIPLLAEAIEDALACIRSHVSCFELQRGRGALPEELTSFLCHMRNQLQKNLLDGFPAAGQEKARPLKILLADDEDLVRHLIGELLTREGHQVMEVADGKEAIEALDSGIFEVVFTDINMPGANGIEVLKKAKQISPDLEVVIITGYASVDNAADAVRFGAYDYLTKPFQGGVEIFATVKRLRDKLQMRRRNVRLLLDLQRSNDKLRRYAENLEDAVNSAEENRRALVHADRMATLGVLSAGVAHEINNPNTFIRGNLQTLSKFWESIAPLIKDCAKKSSDQRLAFVTEETPCLIQDMIVGTERITKIVKALQSFSHQGGSDSERVLTDLPVCVQNALALLNNRIKHGVRVVCEFAESLPLIKADPQQLTQVFVNLFVNSIDAMEGREESLLRISITEHDGELVAAVEDNGVGVPEEIREKIFTPFFTTKKVGKGTGLGLSILIGILHDHGARISLADSNLGGARFDLFFPIAGGKKPVLKRSRVLVVDDNQDSLNIMEVALQASGKFEIDLATSGKEALAMIKRRSPDVLVLDLIMPDMDGFELIGALRENGLAGDMKIIVITGLTTECVTRHIDVLGIDRVFFKPFGINELINHIVGLISPSGMAKPLPRGIETDLTVR